jgi:hypothetical protein
MATETRANAEQTAAWDGPLFDRFLQYRDIFTGGLGLHGERALAMYPPQGSAISPAA